MSVTGRRDFLRLATTGVASVAFAIRCGGEASPAKPPLTEADLPPTAIPLDEVLGRVFADASPADVSLVGATYADDFGGAPSSLAADLTLAVAQVQSASTVEDAVSRLNEAVDSEHATATLYALRGWHLAPTQLRLCALVAVLDPGAWG